VELGSSKLACWQWCSPCWLAAESGQRETAPSLRVASGAVGLVANRGWCCCAPSVAPLQADQLLTWTWCSPSDWVRKRRLMNSIMENGQEQGQGKDSKKNRYPQNFTKLYICINSLI
jgi:hypothetical protein